MIRWLIAPEMMPDYELLREYEETNGEDDRARSLLAEIERRGLDI